MAPELPVTITGTVIEGYRQARSYGTPSANVEIPDLQLDRGVYFGSTTVDGVSYPSLVYFGGPRGNLGGKLVVESHLIDQQMDLYGKEIAVTLITFMRAKVPFTSEVAIKEYIARDLEAARKMIHV